MPHVRHQRDSIARDRFAPGPRFFQHPCREGVAQIVDPRAPRPTGRNRRDGKDFVERPLRDRVIDFPLSFGKEEVIVAGRDGQPQLHVPVENGRHAWV